MDAPLRQEETSTLYDLIGHEESPARSILLKGSLKSDVKGVLDILTDK